MLAASCSSIPDAGRGRAAVCSDSSAGRSRATTSGCSEVWYQVTWVQVYFDGFRTVTWYQRVRSAPSFRGLAGTRAFGKLAHWYRAT